MDAEFQAGIDKCMAEVEEFLRKKRLRYLEFMALTEPGTPGPFGPFR
ncbi:MAG: hypothetical protein ABSE86_29395 [Bryobacteraceae bacterium]|jgi:hypothetical protein